MTSHTGARSAPRRTRPRHRLGAFPSRLLGPRRRLPALPLPRLALPGAFLAVALLLAADAARAHAPDHRWRTLETPHFLLHFHETLYPLAQRSANALERAHERLAPFLAAAPPRRTHVVLVDDTDDPNGAATAFERPRIWLHAAPPDDLSVLGDYDDYVSLLVAHEYFHVLHLGTVSGPPAWLSWLFGARWNPNQALPRFLTEGMATYHETLLSAGGRGRAAIFDMYLRADALEGRLMPLSQLTSGGLRWPRGHAAYLYGGRFVGYLAETRGDEVIRAFLHEKGDDLIPYSINRDLERITGQGLLELWEEWLEALRHRYAAQAALVDARGPRTEPALRTRRGHGTSAPRWSRDGRSLYYVEATADRRPRLRALDRESGVDRVIARMERSGTLSPLPSGEGVITARPEIFRAHRIHGELFRVDARGERRLSRGLRAWEPDLSPDGAHVYFVQKSAGQTRLLRVPLEARDATPEIVYTPPQGREIFTPRVSPDGAWIALSQSRQGPGRDIWIVPTGGGREPLPITDDEATDLDPTWSPDGAGLIFASDRLGIFNLYLASLDEPAPLIRLTNVLTGAFQPDLSPDGSWLAWTTYGSQGYDVAAAPLSSLHPAPAEPFRSDRPARLRQRPAERIYPIRPYRPLPTLAPQSWFPYFGADREGTVLGFITQGSDAVDRHGWALSAGYGLASGEPEAAFTYTYGGFYLRPGLRARTAYRSVPGFPVGTAERISVGALQLDLPLLSLRRSQSFRLGYELTHFEPLRWVSEGWRPEPGLATELQLGWEYDSTERPLEAVVPEAGITAGLLGRIGSAALGGDFDYRGLDAAATSWLRLPWASHHVLALGGRLGLGSGDLGDRHLYGLGGPPALDPIAIVRGGLLGFTGLRGYAPAAFVGSRLLLASAEYHFPLLWIDRSPGTLPLYAGKLAGSVFTEAGSAFDGDRIPRLHPSLGAELRLGFDIAWGFTGSLRMGYAYGLDVADEGGSWPYLGIGAAF